NETDGLYWTENLGDHAQFATPQLISNHNSNFIQLEDFDSDNDLDIIKPRTDIYDKKNDIIWFENKDGKGKFGNAQTILARSDSPGTYCLIDDVDKDGDKDLLVSHHSNSGLVWYENRIEQKPSAFLSPSFSITNNSAYNSYASQIVDIDQDGLKDVVARTTTRDEVIISWHKNLGHHEFEEQMSIQFPRPTHGFTSLFAEDLDNDNDIDILATNGFFLENIDGKGNFVEKSINILKPEDWPNYFSMEQVDEDTLIDLLFITNKNHIYYAKNLGNLTFAEPKLLIEALGDVYNYTFADIFKDGHKDFIYKYARGNSYSQGIAWVPNGGGWFLPNSTKIIEDYERVPGKLQFTVLDFDNDDILDIIALLPDDKQRLGVYLYRNNGTPFQLELEELVPPSKEIKGLSTLDYNEDGLEDIITINEPEYNGVRFLYVHERTKMGEMLPPKRLIDYQTSSISQFVDLDNDGDLDAFSRQYLRILESNQAQIGFDTIHSIHHNLIPDYLVPEDINQDGLIDLIVKEKSSKSPNLHWLQQDTLNSQLYLRQAISIGGNGDASQIFEDIDLDGRLDILEHQSFEGFLKRYQNLPNGLGTPVEFSNQPQLLQRKSYTPRAYDIDGDGDRDLISLRYNLETREKKIIVLVNMDGVKYELREIAVNADSGNRSMSNIYFLQDGKGQGTFIFSHNHEFFRLIQEHPFGSVSKIERVTDNRSIVRNIYIFDMNEDGREDIFYIRRIRDVYHLMLLAHQDDGTFVEQTIGSFPEVRASNGRAAKLFPVDFDRDGDIDLPYFDGVGDLRWIENTGFPHYFSKRHFIRELGVIPDTYNVTDFDQDQDYDVVYTGDNSIFWLENLSINDEQKLIQGICYHDENQNQQFDSTELRLINQKIELQPAGKTVFTDENGQYTFYATNGQYELVPTSNDVWKLAADSTTIPIELTYESSVHQNIGLLPEKDTSSLSTYLTSGPTRCGFEVPFWVEVVNNGTNTEGGFVQIVLDSHMVIQSAISNTNLTFFRNEATLIFDSLLPSHSIKFSLLVKMPGVELIGETFTHRAINIIFNANAEIVSDTTENHSFLTCAYDPNDKLVQPDRTAEENYAKFGEPLIYTIRFQNTGNDTAFNVVIRDQLDDNLDWSSLTVLSSSHPQSTLLDENGEVAFHFNDILLPDSIVNEPLSHGFIKFSLHPKPNLPENTVISNTGRIYFDFNPPIITNTIQNTLVSNIPFITNPYLKHTSCSDVSDGSIELNLIEEIPPYQYKWAHTNSRNPNLQQLSSGQYRLTVTDGLNNTDIFTFNVDSPKKMGYHANIIPASSTGLDGKIELIPYGGNPPYQIYWDKYPDIQANELAQISNGIYHFDITDARGCILSDSIQIGLPTSIPTFQHIESFSIFPNPNNGQFSIKLNLNNVAEVDLQLLSIFGQPIYAEKKTAKNLTQKIDLNGLSSGIYFFKVKVAEEILLKKVIIQPKSLY
ncbi:MAG: FG-GAP-like repeat-containing protein, partial [Bacteroidota bacterium]